MPKRSIPEWIQSKKSIIKKINVFRILTTCYKGVFGLRGLGNDTYAVSTIWIQEMAAKTAKQMLLAVRSSQGGLSLRGVAMFDVCWWYLTIILNQSVTDTVAAVIVIITNNHQLSIINHHNVLNV